MGFPYIHKIEISNFRNFDKFTLTMEPTSVVVGENRVGKSNLLEALRLVLDPSIPDTLRQLRAEDFSDELDAPFSGHVVEVKVYLRGFEQNRGAKSVLADCIVGTNPLTALLTYQCRPRNAIDVYKSGESDYEFIVFGGLDEKTKVAGEVRKYLAMVVLPALRDAETDLQTWKKSPLRPLLDRVRKLIDPDKLKSVRDELDKATDALLAEPLITQLVTAINDQIRDLAGPLHHVKTQFDFASSEAEQLLRSIRLYINEGTTRPLGDASLGTTNILFLSLLLQDLEQRQQTNEVASTILAIEEPEAHLHPQLQRQIFRNFFRRDHSVIVTTHSPSLASVAPINSLVLLRKTGKTTNAFTTRKLNLAAQEIDDLQKYLDVTRAEMLFARGVILVEGAAEVFLVPAFAGAYLQAENKATSLDDFGIAVCSVNGTDFGPYHKLLSPAGLSIPHVSLTDGDLREANGNKSYDGLNRGMRLVDLESRRKKVEELIAAKEFHRATEALETDAVFVGNSTLELDLLPNFADEIKEAYAELRNSQLASNRFGSSVATAINGGVEGSKEMLARIEAVGKGRFAQRLVSKVGQKSPPAYIAKGIERIIKIVANGDA
jgi:putative ATP-dependent endonuclease of OLD family